MFITYKIIGYIAYGACIPIAAPIRQDKKQMPCELTSLSAPLNLISTGLAECRLHAG